MQLHDLQAWAPPTKKWAIAQGGVLLVLCVWVLLRMSASDPVEAQAGAAPTPAIPSPYLVYEDDLKSAVRETFPAKPKDALYRVEVLTDLGKIMEELGLHLGTTRVDALPDTAEPRRQRIHLTVEGTPRAHSLLVHRVLASPHPLVISGFQWNVGESHENRQLTLTLDLLIGDQS